jgi:acid stress-induced BolA-like protein IbaG/YrbA
MSASDLKKLTASLRKKFGGEVGYERINSKGRYRLEIISPKFAKMTQLQRQDSVWAVVDQVLSRQATLGISMILTYSPAELAATR